MRPARRRPGVLPRHRARAASGARLDNAAMDLTDRATFVHWSREKVRWADQDGARHINNVAYAEYLEDARLELILAGVWPHRAQGDNFTVRKVTIEYRASGSYPAEVEIGSCVSAVGETSFTVGQGIFLGDRCLVTGETVHVHHAKGDPKALTDELRGALDALRPAS